MKSCHQLWTFEYPNGQRAQLDYILFRKKWHNSIQDSRSYSSFSSVVSDHRIVSAKARLSLRSSKPSKHHPLKSIDWASVSSDSEISSKFAVDVFNRFSSLQVEELNIENIEQTYSNLISATEKVAL